MLQQTQASRVIPFFSRWMDLFPTPKALASAHEEEVIKAWEGLGYYSRARALHKAAKIIVEHYNGVIPKTEKELLELPGIGPYTAGAIRAFAFHKKAAAVDANVMRVMTRLTIASTREEVIALVERILPKIRPWKTMEGLIELGALICKPTPCCSNCPLSDQCTAFASKTQNMRPEKQVTKRISLWRDAVIFLSQGSALIAHKTGKQVMSGLYEFPYFESSPQGRSSADLLAFLQPLVPSKMTFITSLPQTSHSFTRFHAVLYPTVIASEEPFSWPQSVWIPIHELKSFPFSSGHKRILDNLLSLKT
jgi:A/G-specific adenine glycosylase